MLILRDVDWCPCFRPPRAGSSETDVSSKLFVLFERPIREDDRRRQELGVIVVETGFLSVQHLSEATIPPPASDRLNTPGIGPSLTKLAFDRVVIDSCYTLQTYS
ncbi:hypothetical protein [Thiocapsa marina]|uniref:Uncharacterized protein n=1 Tax=Thiocapsa marina 5811 TaxID=768671 RepID=F9U9Y6_9GAMM|nr:hypothetical protein [Thiocapsa marina]EGV18934.1 hypothetical protein ThimaDRAFT_1738 [Thiocapsa marina 5811]